MRIKKERKQEIEQELVDIAERIAIISKEIERSIHMDITYNDEESFTENEKTTVCLYLHGKNTKGDKRTFISKRSEVGESFDAIKGILSERPEYYE